jgi:hypothetical protein
MAENEPKSSDIGKIAVRFVVVSVLCGLAILCFPQIRVLRGLAGAGGFMLGSIGCGVALWCSIRERDRTCYLACLLSLPNVFLWGWVFQLSIYDWPA